MIETIAIFDFFLTENARTVREPSHVILRIIILSTYLHYSYLLTWNFVTKKVGFALLLELIWYSP